MKASHVLKGLGLVAGLAAVLCQSAAQAAAAAPPTAIERITASLQSSQKCAKGSVAVVVIGKDGPAQAFAGLVQYPNSNARAAPNGKTVYEIGSITKTFTALLLAEAVDQHLLKLDDDAQKYLPRGVVLPTYSEKGQAFPIRLIDLVTHTSGLPAGTQGTHYPYSLDQMNSDLAKIHLTRKPGAAYEYSSLGISVLGEVLAKVFNKPIEQLLVERVATPLGMTDTTVDLSDQEAERVPNAFGPTGKPAPHDKSTWPAFDASGALRSTIDDLQNYLAFMMNGNGGTLDGLRPQLFEWRDFPTAGGKPGSKVEIGLAWDRSFPFGKNADVIGKDGGVPGFESYIAFSQALGWGAVVLANQGGCPVERAALCLIKTAADGVGPTAKEPACTF
jgi:serine-type D-Ala-D-Ala carboxypeptidase/endopeptidase